MLWRAHWAKTFWNDLEASPASRNARLQLPSEICGLNATIYKQLRTAAAHWRAKTGKNPLEER